MSFDRIVQFIAALALAAMTYLIVQNQSSPNVPSEIPAGREEVVFWHFWGGQDRAVVDDVVQRFNESQTDYYVRAIAMPGNNLQAKIFLSVAGGDSPDLVNQDDPVIPDWAHRGVIHSLDEIAPPEEVASVQQWLLPSARRLSEFDGEMFGVCNGLDIRALYYNQSMLEQYGLQPPKTTDDLDRIAQAIAPANQNASDEINQFGYLPDTRRLWAWGYAFGGDFYDENSKEMTVDSANVVRALDWMASYRDRYGADRIAAYRKSDQSLPNKSFPLLPVGSSETQGRYAVLMDGQWRVRDIKAFQQLRSELGQPVPEFGVCPLPVPSSGPSRADAGWVNGNFFVFPKNAKNSRGAWEFAKFWIGYRAPDQAAKTCADGGWIPVSSDVIESRPFQDYLRENPMFAEFVRLAGSRNQFPTPQVVGAAVIRRTVESASYEAMFTKQQPNELLKSANERLQERLHRNHGDEVE